MKQYGSRMELISIQDLNKAESVEALKFLRKKCPHHNPKEDEALYDQIYDLVGGRLAFLSKVAKANNMIDECRNICEIEKTWLLVR